MLPLLYEHFRNEGVTSDMFLLDWMLSIFTKVQCHLSLYFFLPPMVVFSSWHQIRYSAAIPGTLLVFIFAFLTLNTQLFFLDATTRSGCTHLGRISIRGRNVFNVRCVGHSETLRTQVCERFVDDIYVSKCCAVRFLQFNTCGVLLCLLTCYTAQFVST